MNLSRAAVLLLSITAVGAVELASKTPFFDWIDQASVLKELSPSDEQLTDTVFLEYVVDKDTGEDFKQYADLDVRALKTKGCDGSFDCALYNEKPDEESAVAEEEPYYKPARQAPEVKFPAGRIPRTARCYITCDYQTSFEFEVGKYTTKTEPKSDFSTTTDGMTPGRHATKAHAAASSFLETGSQEGAGAPDDITVYNQGSPFHCKTQCDFKKPNYCNPVRRMVVGGAGYSPMEHECCEKCEQACAAKTIVDRYRVCYLGCRAFCPFLEDEA